ncbi:Probable dynein light chain [Linum perenne]
MLEGKAVVDDADMPQKMQIQAMASAYEALDLYDVSDCLSIAGHIKKVKQLEKGLICVQEFDMRYGSGWQCVVGSNFGCFFTHSKGTFVYFTLETLKFLIFKGASSST